MILFLHIPKTGGVSMLVSLAETFGRQIMPVPYADENPVKPGAYPYRDSMSPVDDNMGFDTAVARQYAAVAGHFDWGVRQRLPEARVFTLLREPVAHVVSQFRQAKRARVPDGWNRGFFQQMQDPAFGLPEFLELSGFQNVQTRVLAGVMWSRGDVSTSEAVLRDAQANLAACDCFGLLEEYGRAVQRINARLGMRLRGRHENRAVVPALPIPAELRWQIEHCNRFDVELYRYAEQLLREKGVSDSI